MEQEALQRARAKRAAEIADARADVGKFVEFAFRHERDGSRVTNAWFHKEWHELRRQHPRLVVISAVEHGKTQHFPIAEVVHALGTDPNHRLAVIGNTSQQAGKLLRSIRAQVERNPYVQLVFPHLKRSQHEADPWHQTALTVERSTVAKEPSVQVCGAFGAINGSRLDGVVVDDVLNFKNTRTSALKRKLVEWIDTEVLTRLTEDAWAAFVGTPWAPDDLLAELATRKRFVHKVYPAVVNPDEPPEAWVPQWPEAWPLKRILERREDTQPHSFDRTFLCRVSTDLTGRFQRSWLDGMVSKGRGRTFLDRPPRSSSGESYLQCFTGVDLGIGHGSADAESVIFTIAVVPESGERVVVSIQAGRWTSPEIIELLVAEHGRYNSIIGVEDNGAQSYLVQMAEGQIPVYGLTTTGYSKHHEEWGVESLALEIRRGLWVLPSGPTGEEIPEQGLAWLDEMLQYDPTAHTGDRLMASWIARETYRRHGGSRVRWVGITTR